MRNPTVHSSSDNVVEDGSAYRGKREQNSKKDQERKFDAQITSVSLREVSSQHSYSGGSHPVFHPVSRHLHRYSYRRKQLHPIVIYEIYMFLWAKMSQTFR
ncbi:hypothetical protein RHSIM_Rhsim02G0141900 [Rhododendron simsii]|uniref:Uncharacterized protein n=1 Tax=Rhododendron simsii TaxID=118357 RepID=A0A834HDF2_RHOSS|nr:hypothetical protein RHSIM_Rhsim02G0141900 [Rhododendron simsii]